MGSSASVLPSSLETATTAESLIELIATIADVNKVIDVEDFDSLKKVILHSNISGAYILELCSKSSDSAELNVKIMDLVNSMGVSNEKSRDFLVTKIIEKYNAQKLVNSMEVNNGVAETLKFDVVFVLGGPGCGKGTNCARIVAEFDYVHLSAGDLLRAARESGSDLADMINTYIKEGRIVPAEITVGLLKTAMEQSGKKKFLVDGFPRDMSNLESWEASMSSVTTVQFLLFLDCSEETMLARLLERGKTSGRSDDNIESIKKRFLTYEQSTRPIINRFKELNRAREVDANRDIELVYADVASHFRAVQ